jgi:hypothetical protein
MVPLFHRYDSHTFWRTTSTNKGYRTTCKFHHTTHCTPTNDSSALLAPLSRIWLAPKGAEVWRGLGCPWDPTWARQWLIWIRQRGDVFDQFLAFAASHIARLKLFWSQIFQQIGSKDRCFGFISRPTSVILFRSPEMIIFPSIKATFFLVVRMVFLVVSFDPFIKYLPQFAKRSSQGSLLRFDTPRAGAYFRGWRRMVLALDDRSGARIIDRLPMTFRSVKIFQILAWRSPALPRYDLNAT